MPHLTDGTRHRETFCENCIYSRLPHGQQTIYMRAHVIGRRAWFREEGAHDINRDFCIFATGLSQPTLVYLLVFSAWRIEP